MADNDKELGKRIHKVLAEAGKETPLHVGRNPAGLTLRDVEITIAHHMYEVLSSLELDLTDDSLRDTPNRVAKMYCHEVFSGLNYDNFPKCSTFENKMNYDEIVLVKDIVIRSCCEHHLQGIYGKAHIAYIPNTLVIGLSKFARIADFFASRPQVQERMTEQIYTALQYILGTDDIAVIIDAEHFCMKMRGVQDACSSTTTSKMGGRFKSVPSARAELLALVSM